MKDRCVSCGHLALDRYAQIKKGRLCESCKGSLVRSFMVKVGVGVSSDEYGVHISWQEVIDIMEIVFGHQNQEEASDS